METSHCDLVLATMREMTIRIDWDTRGRNDYAIVGISYENEWIGKSASHAVGQMGLHMGDGFIEGFLLLLC